MANKNTTKRVLILSVLALLLCFTMLLGTTFAWFTDTVTSGKNTIVAGNLDIALEYSKTMADDSWTTVEDATDLFDDEALWEPGHAEVVYLRIRNLGSLALKYKLSMNIANETHSINVNGGILKLSEHLKYAIVDTTVAYADRAAAVAAAAPTATALANYSVEGEMIKGAAAKTVALVVYMPETVNNEANYAKDAATPTIELGVSVVATQLAHESDSFNNQYDVNAMYEVAEGLYVDENTGVYVATNKAGLGNFATFANNDDTITSVTYVDEAGAATEVPVVRDNVALNDALVNDNEYVVLTDGKYIVPDSAKNNTMTIVGSDNTVLEAQDDGASEGDCDYSFEGATVTFENVTIETKGGSYPGYVRMNATYNNCTIKGTYTLYGDSVFNNCTFNLNNGYVWTWGAANVTFNGCTFEDDAAKAILVHNTTPTTVTVKDCTFIATTPKQTWDGIAVAAVSIDPENGSPAATVHFEGTNTYSSAFNGLYQLKYGTERDVVTVTVDGVEVDVPVMKEAHP